jgi:hypothetical protein
MTAIEPIVDSLMAPAGWAERRQMANLLTWWAGHAGDPEGAAVAAMFADPEFTTWTRPADGEVFDRDGLDETVRAWHEEIEYRLIADLPEAPAPFINAAYYARSVMRDVMDLMDDGQIPYAVASFEELHDYCDPNQLLINHMGATIADMDNQEHANRANAVADEVGRQLAAVAAARRA